MFGLGANELVVIAIIVLLLFGARRLPEIGKGLGGALREFRNIKKEMGSNDKSQKGQEDTPVLKEKETPKSLEAKLGEKVLEQLPGVKKAMEVKQKADSIKELIK
jgi:sec-independent protein translocase protein TatA